MGQGTKRDIMLPVGWPWAPLTTVWKFVVLKKSTSAIQEFLKSGSNEVYHSPERPQRVSGNSSGKYSSQILTNVCKNWTAFLADISLLEGRTGTDIRETLTLLMCAYCRLFCEFLDGFFFPFFGTFFTFRVFFAFGANGEVACHSQEHLKPCVLYGMTYLINDWIITVFVEQPLASPRSAKKGNISKISLDDVEVKIWVL